MKLTTALLLSNTPLIVAFTPPRPQALSPKQSYQFQPAEQQPRSLSLPLFPDPSSLESSTMLTSELVNPFVDFLGGVSLFGSIGYGIFVGAKNQTDWDYEYTAGNEEAVDKYGDKDDLTDAQKDFFGSDSTVAPPPAPKPEPPAPAPKKPKFFKKKTPAPPAPEPPAPEPPAPKPPAPKPAAPKPPAPAPKPPAAPSIKDEIESAKKDILDNKLPAPEPKPAPKPSPVVEPEEPEPPTPEPTPEPPAPVVEQEKKKGGLKRKLVQSATFLTIAGLLGATRKIVISWLGNGIL